MQYELDIIHCGKLIGRVVLMANSFIIATQRANFIAMQGFKHSQGFKLILVQDPGTGTERVIGDYSRD